MNEIKGKKPASERDELFTELRQLTPGERLVLRIAAKAEAKTAKREQRAHLGASK